MNIEDETLEENGAIADAHCTGCECSPCMVLRGENTTRTLAEIRCAPPHVERHLPPHPIEWRWRDNDQGRSCMRCGFAVPSGYRHLHAVWCNTRSKEESGMSERQQILSKFERVWDLNPDKSFTQTLNGLLLEYLPAHKIIYGDTEDSYLLERLNEIIDEHENGECPDD